MKEPFLRGGFWLMANLAVGFFLSVQHACWPGFSLVVGASNLHPDEKTPLCFNDEMEGGLAANSFEEFIANLTERVDEDLE